MLPCCTNIKPQSTDGTPHNYYSCQKSVCLTCCTVALSVRTAVQTVHRTIAIVSKSQSAYLLHCCTSSKPQNTDGTPHNYYSGQQSVCLTCCTVALSVRPAVQTVHRTIAIVANSQSAYLLPCCTNSKPHSTDCSPHNCYCDQQSVCPSCCPVAPTISPRVQTVHRTIAIVTNSQSAIPVALLH